MAISALDPLILDPVHLRANELEEEDPEGFDDHRARVCGSMILAMKDLDEEGLFGSGEERGAVVLLCDLVEPPEKYWFAVESARRLNPPEVFDGFLKQWLAWLSPNDRAPIEIPRRIRRSTGRSGPSSTARPERRRHPPGPIRRSP